MKALILVSLVVLCAACQTRTTSLRDGTSVAQAIQLRAKDHGAGLAAEHDWLRRHLPGARLAEGGVGVNASGEEVIHLSHRTEADGEAIFSVYTMRLADGHLRDVFFDQSNYFGK